MQLMVGEKPTRLGFDIDVNWLLCTLLSHTIIKPPLHINFSYLKSGNTIPVNMPKYQNQPLYHVNSIGNYLLFRIQTSLNLFINVTDNSDRPSRELTSLNTKAVGLVPSQNLS